ARGTSGRDPRTASPRRAGWRSRPPAPPGRAARRRAGRRTARSGCRSRARSRSPRPRSDRSPDASGLAADPVHRTAGGLPGVVRGARAEGRLVDDDARVAADLLGALRVPEQVGVVALLPHEHEVRRRHEAGDKRAPRRRAREGIGAHAVPAGTVAVLVVAPELLVFERRLAGEGDGAALQPLALHAGRIRIVPGEAREGVQRDVAVVLSGGGMNGVLLELGFLQRLRRSSLWPRVGWIYGTSAGALAGTMAALDRLDDLEQFLLRLQPEEAFRPNRLWQLPL